MRLGFHFDKLAAADHGSSGSASGWFFEPVLGIGLGFAGGAMIYLVMAEMLPEAIQEGGKTLAAWGVMLGLCTMLMSNLINLLLPHSSRELFSIFKIFTLNVRSLPARG